MDQESSRRTAAATAGPRLLVSVRSVEETLAALESGVEILDFKDPLAGPLAPLARPVLADCLSEVARRAPAQLCSAALGEVRDYIAETIDAAGPGLPAGVHYAKLGLSGLASDPNWITRWQQLRHAIDEQAGRSLAWIAVAYADADRAAAPTLTQVLEAAVSTQCHGVLIDTFDKSGGRLTQLLSPAVVAAWIEQARAAGLVTALAGRVSADDLGWLLPTQPDVIGIRSAACRGNERTAAVDIAQLRLFQSLLRSRSPTAEAPGPLIRAQ